jgi:hypothetical protein
MFVYGSSYSCRDGYEGVGFPAIILIGFILVDRIWCVWLVPGIYRGNM